MTIPNGYIILIKVIRKLRRWEAVSDERTHREETVGVSFREAVGEVVPEHWAERKPVSLNGFPSVIGEGRVAPISAGS